MIIYLKIGYYKVDLISINTILKLLYIIPWKVDQSLRIMEKMICMWTYLDKSLITCIFVYYI